MSKVIVTVVSSAAVACAIAMIAAWGRLDTSFRSEHDNAIIGTLRRLCVLEVSGIIAGLLVGGFGSRLMMRIMAATSSAAAQGRITQADEVVGRVTQHGTVGLLIFVGIGFGIVGAGLYALVGRFLPAPAWMSGGVLGLLALGIFARRDPLDPTNRDFALLSPVALAVVLIVVLFVFYGVTLAALTARLERSYPHALLAYAPLVLLVVPPFTVALLAAVVVGTVRSRFPDLGRELSSGVAGTTGAVVVAAATIAGNVWLAFAVSDILS